MAIYELISAAHDGHFTYFFGIFKGFFLRGDLVQDLVSVSVGGIEARKLYLACRANGTNNAKIKTVVVGGRPDPALGTLKNTSTGPMQAVGEVAGAQILYFFGLHDAAQSVLVLSSELNNTANSTDNEDLLLLAEGYAMKRSLVGINGDPHARSVNRKNNFISLDDLKTPVQF
ncbi:hypothetical protein QBC36DRAFT_291665 [Triangularia setosa]|uniref:Uncharacterized protein n=1 Tax=Triangularia setosa TaxID=2587417 RepID=A0AAN6W4I7_9PEZI|nr:hypothetical protein QBC36DRAFT_291665 [Podospora setosa]